MINNPLPTSAVQSVKPSLPADQSCRFVRFEPADVDGSAVNGEGGDMGSKSIVMLNAPSPKVRDALARSILRHSLSDNWAGKMDIVEDLKCDRRAEGRAQALIQEIQRAIAIGSKDDLIYAQIRISEELSISSSDKRQLMIEIRAKLAEIRVLALLK